MIGAELGSGPILVFYINGHGFGHATRSLAILQEIWSLRPQQRVVLRTDAPRFLFDKGCSGPCEILAGPVDPGTVQADPLQLDVEASLQARARMQDSLAEQVEAECVRLASRDVGLIAGDIPPLAFEVGSRLGVPSVALGNFSWDWIYEPYVASRPELQRLVEGMQSSYACADLLLRMPLHGNMDAFSRVLDIPHVARRARSDRASVRRSLGLEGETRPLVLVSFGGFAAVQFADPADADPGPFRFVTFGEPLPGMPEDTVCLPVAHGYRHEDLVAASDALITKPGYGTVAECLAARTPFLYTSRDHFREYDVLVAGIRRDARARFVPQEDLLALRWRPYFEELLADRKPWGEVPLGGAEVAARRLLERLSPGDPPGTLC